MQRILAITAVAAIVASTGAAEAKRYKQDRHVRATPMRVAPAPVQPNAPRWWVGPPTCWSDEGYGRFTSCDNSGRGG